MMREAFHENHVRRIAIYIRISPLAHHLPVNLHLTTRIIDTWRAWRAFRLTSGRDFG